MIKYIRNPKTGNFVPIYSLKGGIKQKDFKIIRHKAKFIKQKIIPRKIRTALWQANADFLGLILSHFFGPFWNTFWGHF